MSDFSITKTTICGFRGFTKAQQIEFGQPLTIFIGGNRNGKSSVLNAIEWCLFGPDVAAIKYGDIRERDGWEVQNLHSPTCYVECEFQSAVEGTKVVARRTFKSTRASDFWYQIEKQPKITDDRQLHALLNISVGDFLSSVHLHPEVVRNLVIAKPKERKEAIDRLLGLSELRDIESALAAEKPSSWAVELDREITVLNEKLTLALTAKQKTVQAESEDLLVRGISETDLNATGACRRATELRARVVNFAQQYGLPELSLCAPDSLGALRAFLNTLPTVILQLRKQHPTLADQGRDLTKKNTLEGLKNSYVAQLKEISKAELSLNSYPEMRKTEEIENELKALALRVAELDTEMSQVSKNAKVLDSALAFFTSRATTDQLQCPLCGMGTKTVAEWRVHLQAEITRNNLAPLQTEKSELLRSSESLNKAKADIIILEKRIAGELAKLAAIIHDVEKVIGRKLVARENPALILDHELKIVAASLEALQSQVEVVNTSLEGFQDTARVLDRMQRIARTRLEIEQIESVTSNKFYKELQLRRTECEQYAEDVDLLLAGLQNAVVSEAKKSLATAQATISANFTTLTNRPDFPGLRVTATGDGYAIELINASENVKAVPVLNQGDMNCAALAIFLGLAASQQITHRLGIVILDDPSQSLDSACKTNLCELLSKVCETRQVIISTADAELGAAATQMAKNKIVCSVKDWNPIDGPKIEIQVPEYAL